MGQEDAVKTYRQARTCDSEFSVGDVWTTHHTVVALIFDLAVVDFKTMAVAHTTDAVLVAGFQFLGAFVPSQTNLWIVDPDLALEGGVLILRCVLICDVLQHSNRLKK